MKCRRILLVWAQIAIKNGLMLPNKQIVANLKRDLKGTSRLDLHNDFRFTAPVFVCNGDFIDD